MLIHCPPGLTAKGRNGYFAPDTVRLCRAYPFTDDRLFIEIRSRRIGDAAPVVLAGPPVELCALLQAIIDAVGEVEATIRILAARDAAAQAADAAQAQP